MRIGNIIIVILVLFNLRSWAQEIYPSNTAIQVCYNNENCFGNQQSSFLLYNESNHEFYIVVDFSKFKIGIDSLDMWLQDLDNTKFVFTGVLNYEKLPALSNHGFKTIHVNGKSDFNNTSHPYSIELVLFKISPDGMLFRNTGNDYYDRIRANVQISFKPRDFKLDKKHHHLTKSISINIGSGYINQLKPGMEDVIKH